MPDETVRIFIEGKDGLSPAAGKARTALGNVEKAAISAKKRLNDMASGMSSLGNKMMLLTMPLLAIGGAATKMAMDAVESENLFTVSMGDMAEAGRAFSEQMREQLGLNAYEVRKNLGTWKVMFEAMGFGKQAALDMGEGLTKLAYDMSSFYNIHPEEMFEKLRSGIAGEIEPMRRLGIVIGETEVEAWALAHGLIKSGQEMSQAQKTAVRYQMILEQTSKAQGDLARTMDSPTNQLRIMKERFTEIGIEAGQVFLPMVSAALSWVNNKGIPMVRTALSNFKESWTEMSDHARTKMLVVGGLFLAGGPLLKGIAVGIRGVGALITVFKMLPWQVSMSVAAAGTALVVFHKQIGEFIDQFGQGLVLIAQGWQRVFPNAQGAKDLKDLGWSVAQMGKNLATAKIDFDTLADVALDFGDMLVDPLVKKVEQFTTSLTSDDGLEGAMARVTKGMDVAIPKVDLTANEFAKLAGPVETAKKKVKETADVLKEAGISMQELVGSLIRFHPATVAAAGVTAVWESRISSVNLAIRANQDQLRAAQAEYARMGEHLSELNRQLSEAKTRLSDLTRPNLTGMGALGMQIGAIQDTLARLRLSQDLGLPLTDILKKYPLLTAGAMDYIKTLPLTEEGLQAQLKTLQDLQGVKYDEQLRLLQQAAEGVKPEMTFGAALQGIQDAKGQIEGLTGAIAGQEAAMRSQQGVIQAIQAESERLNQILAAYQEQLKAAQANQTLVTQALQLAFTWLLQDRQGFTELGAEGERVAGVMDAKTSALLQAITGAASDTTAMSSEVLAKMVTNYQTDMAKALLEVGGLKGALDSIPREITTVHRIVTSYETAGSPAPTVPAQGGRYGGSFTVPGFQSGGAFAVGGLGGPDSQLVAFRASPGEVVSITPPGRARASISITVTGNTIIGSETHIAQELARLLKPELDRMEEMGW